MTVSGQGLNVADRLRHFARQMPDAPAVAAPVCANPRTRERYRVVRFRELDADADRIARGLVERGVSRGARLVLMVRPGIEFVTLVFALLRSGATMVLIDPGMGRRRMLECLEAVDVQGFVAIPAVQFVRRLLKKRFARATMNVTVGRSWLAVGDTLEAVRTAGERGEWPLPQVGPDDPAAVIFTTGSTGPPKGVLFTHRNFDAQVEQIRDHYGIRPGEVDLPGFPLFGLFNAAMGVTTIVPEMDPSRPARVDPVKILDAVRQWEVTQSFGSPAIWNVVGRYCEQHGEKLSTLRRVMSAGAPVPADVLRRMKACIHAAGEVHTPYGATESLPVASISATEVLGETQKETDLGAGVCVGRRFAGIQWQVIRISDEPIVSIEAAEPLPVGEIGELIVRGPQVTREYVTRTQWNARSKIADGESFWHRIGDAGYFDQQQRFWFCGRVAHRVVTQQRTLFTACCEAIFNQHPGIYRSALVGLGRRGQQRPVLIVEPQPGQWPQKVAQRKRLIDELRQLAARHARTSEIEDVLLHRSFPVDIRHNAKIFREQLATWAARRLSPSLGR